jgi:histidinol-phosphatase (PHP family)
MLYYRGFAMRDKKVLFHVHSWRCGHAENIPDQAYVDQAIALGADSIVFTDHAPFPGNPFRNRMDYEQLPEYIDTLSSLKSMYEKWITVQLGLEIEYLPSFDVYYKELLENEKIDIFLLGQHHFEISPQYYSFEKDFSQNKTERAFGMMKAQIDGVNSGYFRAIAHPDRCLRDLKGWNSDIERQSKRLIKAAIDNKVLLEHNYSSMKRKREYWQEFWRLVPPDAGTITGCDAHFVKDLCF